MTKDTHRQNIALNVSNATINTLIADMAAVCEERDKLKERVAELEAQLSPKPEAPATD